jgi:dihydrofolate synthase/folylpolyglutamate synthase
MRDTASSTAGQKIETLEQAGAYLEGLINVEKERSVSYERFDLAAIEALLGRLGSPQSGLSVVHIAGSKGKGSTALLTEAVLRAAGERVGTYTSPHLERWTERFRLDGSEVGGERLARAVAELAPHVDSLRETGGPAPTFFDATTAAALLLFRDAAVDHAVVEVGLGGRLDSTNVVAPKVTCITGIELEHTEQLGDTLAEIAREKAGIAKPGVPLIVGAVGEEAWVAIEACARDVGAPILRLGRDFHVEVRALDLDGQQLHIEHGEFAVDVGLPVCGVHQADNAVLALVCSRLALPGVDLAGACRRAFETVSLPGRIELLARDPWVVVDSAHTAASAAALAAVLDEIPSQRRHVVLSVSAGKDVDAIVTSLLQGAGRVTLTRAEPKRSLAPEEVARVVRRLAPGSDVDIVLNPHLALRAAAESLAPGDLLCVAGSIYLAGIARGILATDRNVPVEVSRR